MITATEKFTEKNLKISFEVDVFIHTDAIIIAINSKIHLMENKQKLTFPKKTPSEYQILRISLI